MTVYVPAVPPLISARAYLRAELDRRSIDLPVGVVPPPGEPRPYVLLSRPGGNANAFLANYLLRVRVFDFDAVELEKNTELLHRLMLAASHTKVQTPLGDVWVTAATHQMSPAEFDDPAVPMFGYQFAVFWTFGLRKEQI